MVWFIRYVQRHHNEQAFASRRTRNVAVIGVGGANHWHTARDSGRPSSHSSTSPPASCLGMLRLPPAETRHRLARVGGGYCQHAPASFGIGSCCAASYHGGVLRPTSIPWEASTQPNDSHVVTRPRPCWQGWTLGVGRSGPASYMVFETRGQGSQTCAVRKYV